jgi:predicted Fe-S protein YdhL (DUF1289 family)
MPASPLSLDEAPQSPCVRHCTLNERDVCLGCGRALAEITGWQAMSHADKAACVVRGRERLVAMGRPLPAYPPLPAHLRWRSRPLNGRE